MPAPRFLIVSLILIALRLVCAATSAGASGVSMTVDEYQGFQVQALDWSLGAESGGLAGTAGPSSAKGHVQVVTKDGYLLGQSATFNPTDGWVDMSPVEGNWRYLSVKADRARLTGKVLELDNGTISTCHLQDGQDYSVQAAKMQLVDFYGYIFIHASDVKLSLFGLPVMWLPRIDLPLDRIVERNRPRTVYADQGWLSPGVGLGGGAGYSANTQFRFLNRPGAKGYLFADYATIRQFNIMGLTELTDGERNLLLGVIGWQSPAPVIRTGAWGYLRGIHATDWGDRVEMLVSARELLGAQIVSRTPEMALVADWRPLGWFDYRYSLRAGEFLLEGSQAVSRMSGVFEMSSPAWTPWTGMTIQPIIETTGRAYLQNTPLIGAGAQLQATQCLGDWSLMARVRQRWATGPNPLFYENYLSDQVVGGMVLWQALPMLRLGLFGEWSTQRQTPVALDLMASLVTDCAGLHVIYSPLYGGLSAKGNLLAF